MKTLFISMLALVSASAFADQSIVCREINKSGSVKVNGGTVKAAFAFKRDGSVDGKNSRITLKGFTKRGSDAGLALENIHSNQSEGARNYTTIFFTDAQVELLEYQLQFHNDAVLDRAFRGVRASLVMGIDEASTEPSPSWGFDLECNGYVN